MKKIFFSFLFSSLFLGVKAQMDIYSSLTIPDSMKKDANVVLRDEYIKFRLKDINSATYEVHDVITVLNENGKDYLNFSEFSYKFQSLDDAEIKVYDVLGVKKNTYSKKEMTSLNYGEGLVPEGKVTYFNVSAAAYPFTIEINYTIKYKGVFGMPGYIIQPSLQSVQHSVFDVEVPSDLGLRYKLMNTDLKPAITHEDGKDKYHWEVKNLTAYKSEKHSGSAYSYEPAVFLAPNKIQLDEYDGDMTSWKNFGNWINKLYQKTSELSEDRKAFYVKMIGNSKTDREKAEILYKYMQEHMRYVSIQLGIGGLRPFPASFVDEKKYGDCKALSNYLRSALSAVGVRSNVVIIQGGMTPRNVPEDFPATYFNHVILCIPQPTDSIWLECTSTTLPFAELGPFTENRKGMMVTEDGGVLVNTPKSNYLNNVESCFTNIQVNENGAASVTASYTSSGEERDILLMVFHDMKPDEKRGFFVREMNWRNPGTIDITTSSKNEDPYLVTARMDYDKIYSFKSGTKFFLEPRLHKMFDEDVPDTKTRIQDYYFTFPYQSTDTTLYKLPEGFSPETLPKNKSVEYPFARYICNYNWDASAHTISVIAILQIKERIVKAAAYDKLLDFRNKVLDDSKEKIVIKKE